MHRIHVPGTNRKEKATWVSITGVPGGGDGNDKRYLFIEVADGSKCFQQISNNTQELLAKFLDALQEDQEQFGEGAKR